MAVGYLVFLAYGWLSGVEWQEDHLLLSITAVFATQVPDLIDKPLAWWFHVLPSGRSLAHSLFAVVLLSLAFRYVVRRMGHGELAVPFFLGYLTHPFADGYQLMLAGKWDLVTYFFYPLTPAPDYGSEGGFISHFARMQLTPSMWFQLGLAAIALITFVVIEYRIRSTQKRQRSLLNSE